MAQTLHQCVVDREHSSHVRGFTLIEMLLVVAIISILLSMLLPGLGSMREAAKESECKSNLRILASAFADYSRDNKRQLIGTNTGQSWDWMGDGNTINSLESGSLWPYIQSHDAYKCPNHVYPWYLNSYSANGKLNGEQQFEGKGKKDYITRNMIPEKQMIFIEEDDHRGWNINSFMLGTNQGKFVDLMPANHNNGDNLSFLDGHVEYFKWEDEQILMRPKHKNGAPSFGFYDPGNVDWDKLNPVFRSWPR